MVSDNSIDITIDSGSANSNDKTVNYNETNVFIYDKNDDELTFKKNKVLKEIKGRYIYSKKSIQGGMGKITFVFDSFMNRNIVIKELSYSKDRITSERKELGFIREALLTAELEHPSIIPIYEIGKKANGNLYYSMKQIKGETLSRLIHKQKKIEERLNLVTNFLNICYAIAYSHERNIIHRDIKPANIMIDKFGETILLDWGLAKHIDVNDSLIKKFTDKYDLLDNENKTINGKVVGTPSYMPPEQARGEILDKRADIYSLGAVLYYILTGHPPFKGKTIAEKLNKVKNEEPIAIKNEDIPKDLIAIVKKSMAKNKNDRYSDVGELISELKRYLSGKKVKVYDYSFFEIIKKTAKNNSVAFASVLIIFFTLIISFILVFNSYQKEKLAIERVKKSLIEEKLANQEANYNFSVSLLEKSLSLIKEYRINESEIYASGAISYIKKNNLNKTDIRNFNIFKKAKSILYQTGLKTNFEFKGFIKNNSNIYKLITSKDKKLLISAGRDGYVNIWELKTYKKIFEKKFDSFITSVDISSDNQQIAVIEKNSHIHVWDIIKNNEVKKISVPFENQDFIIKYSLNNRFLITSGRGGDIIIRNAKTLEETKRLTGHRNIVMNIIDIKKEDSELLVTHDYKNNVIVWDFSTGKILNKLNNIGSLVRSITISNDKNFIIASLENGEIRIWNLLSGKFIKSLKNYENFKVSMGIYKKKYLIAIREYLTIWNYKTGKLLSRMKLNKLTSFSSLALGKNYIFTSSFNKNIKIWKVNINDKYKYKINNHVSIHNISLSENKKYLSVLRDDNKLLLYDFKNKKLIKKSNGNAVSVFSDDNSKLATVHGTSKISIYQINKNNKITENIYFRKNKEFIVSLQFLTPDKLFIGTSSGNIYLLNLKNDKIIKKLKSPNIRNRIHTMALSPDKKYLIASGFNKNIDIWNINNFTFFKTLRNNDLENCVGFTNKNDLLTSGKDRNIKLWDFKNLKIKKIFKGNQDWTNILKVSPNQEDFITISDDNTLKFWTLNEDSYLLSFKLPNIKDALFMDKNTIMVVQKNKIFLYPFKFKGFYKNQTYYENKSQLKLTGFNITAK